MSASDSVCTLLANMGPSEAAGVRKRIAEDELLRALNGLAAEIKHLKGVEQDLLRTLRFLRGDATTLMVEDVHR